MNWNRVSHCFAALIATLVLAGCNSDYPRGQFSGYVIGKTEEQIVAQVGKPVEVDNSNPNSPIWVYKKKTFNVDDRNTVDDRTLVYLKKAPDGKLIGDDTMFM
ncbi:MAG: hypothetical protein NT042_12185 [Sulfuritalea sp.]|nr:hypothetical protein [Sulfuritalea sp.]